MNSLQSGTILAPIDRLPNELLTWIFLLVQNMAKDVAWSRVLEVCSRWHQAGITDPTLWTTIDLDKKGWEMCLKRSKSAAPLTIRSRKSLGFRTFTNAFATHLHRMGKCHLKLSYADDGSAIWASRRLSQLTHLYLSAHDIPEAHVALECLGAMNKLQSLDIPVAHCGKQSRPDCLTTIPPVILPHLSHLKLHHCDFPICMHFIAHLKIPASTYIHTIGIESVEEFTFPSDLRNAVSFITDTPTKVYKLILDWTTVPCIMIEELDEPSRRIRRLQVDLICTDENEDSEEACRLSHFFDPAFGSFTQLARIELIMDGRRIHSSGTWWKALRRMDRVTSLKVTTSKYALSITMLLDAFLRTKSSPDGGSPQILLPSMQTLVLDGFCSKSSLEGVLESVLRLRRSVGSEMQRLEVKVCNGAQPVKLTALQRLVEVLSYDSKMVCCHKEHPFAWSDMLHTSGSDHVSDSSPYSGDDWSSSD